MSFNYSMINKFLALAILARLSAVVVVDGAYGADKTILSRLDHNALMQTVHQTSHLIPDERCAIFSEKLRIMLADAAPLSKQELYIKVIAAMKTVAIQPVVAGLEECLNREIQLNGGVLRQPKLRSGRHGLGGLYKRAFSRARAGGRRNRHNQLPYSATAYGVGAAYPATHGHGAHGASHLINGHNALGAAHLISGHGGHGAHGAHGAHGVHGVHHPGGHHESYEHHEYGHVTSGLVEPHHRRHSHNQHAVGHGSGLPYVGSTPYPHSTHYGHEAYPIHGGNHHGNHYHSGNHVTSHLRPHHNHRSGHGYNGHMESDSDFDFDSDSDFDESDFDGHRRHGYRDHGHYPHTAHAPIAVPGLHTYH